MDKNKRSFHSEIGNVSGSLPDTGLRQSNRYFIADDGCIGAVRDRRDVHFYLDSITFLERGLDEALRRKQQQEAQGSCVIL